MSDDIETVAKRICGECRTGYMVKLPDNHFTTWLCEYCHSKKTYANPNLPLGWQCPVCAKVYSPSVPSCQHCNNQR